MTEKYENEYVQPEEEIRKVEGEKDYYKCDEEGKLQDYDQKLGKEPNE